jgi:hypothetical protein
MRVGYADHHALRDPRAVAQHVLDLGTVHVLPASDDHVLEPVEYVDVPSPVDPADVPGAQPSVVK